MKTIILVLFVCVVSNIQCSYNKQDYTRIKRAKYNYPTKFFKLPPSSSHITGPFSYTPPPGYMSDSGPPPGSLKTYKVSKKPNNGLGDEDIHNLFKYLSKQDINKIVELAVEKDRFSEHRAPFLGKHNYEYDGSGYENQEQRPFYKDFDENLDSSSPVKLKDDKIEYSGPSFDFHRDSSQRVTRNHNGQPIDNFDYPQELVKDYNIPSNGHFNFNVPPISHYEFEREMTRNFNNPVIDNNIFLKGKTRNDHNLIKENLISNPNENFDYPQELAQDYDNPQTDDFSHSQGILKDFRHQNEVITNLQRLINNPNNPQNNHYDYLLRNTKNLNNIRDYQFKYPQGILSDSNPSKATFTDSQETFTYNDLQNGVINNVRPIEVDGDAVQNQLLFLNDYIQKEMSKQRLDINMISGSKQQLVQDQSLPKPSNLRDQDYEVSYTNNIPRVVNTDSDAYKTENFADLPLMNYDDSKLDTVNSYKVPHYTVTQVKSIQQSPVQFPQSQAQPVKPTYELAPPRSAGREQSDAHLKAIKIWTHRSKGMAYTLHDDGTLSPERPIRPKYKPSR